MGTWVLLLRVVTSITQIGMILSPGPDILRVCKQKHTGEMAALPLVAMIVNNHLWTLYGYLTDSIFPLMVSQLVGELAAIVFTALYYRWSSDRRELHKLLAGALVMYLLLTVYFVLGLAHVTNQTKDSVGKVFGYVGVVINLWMYASPLGTIRHVLATKSAASLPINISSMMFVNTALWVAVAIIDHDMIIMSLNIAGFLLSIIQIAVYNRYRPDAPQQPAIDEETGFADKFATVVSPKEAPFAKSPVYQSLQSPTETTRV